MAALARHIEQASRDVQDVHTSSRKITAHFRKIESVQLEEDDADTPGGAPAIEGGEATANYALPATDRQT